MNIDYLKECFLLDSDRGVLIWNNRPEKHFRSSSKRTAKHNCNAWNARFAGSVVQSKTVDGYTRVRLDNGFFRAHRIIYAIHSGQWPEESAQIDHLNGKRSDNRPENLRLVGQYVNQQNRTSLCTRNRSGVAGVIWNKNRGKWMAYAKNSINKKQVYLGLFSDIDDAQKARHKFVEENYPGLVAHAELRQASY
jgi:hypothetical protein